MHVAVIGAGALGRIYGVHLSIGGYPVTFVVRPNRLTETSPFILEQVNGTHSRLSLTDPQRSDTIPEDTTVMLLAVRREQIDDHLEQMLRSAPTVPLVALTPLLPRSQEQIDAVVSGRCYVGLPAVAGDMDERSVVRYFIPRLARTLIEAERGRPPRLVSLLRALNQSGLPSSFAVGVSRRNPATTIAFFPLGVALNQAGTIDALVGDRALLTLALEACTETAELAHHIGPVELPVRALTAVAGPRTLRAALALARRRTPELLGFLESHFGSKLGEQHELMGDEILELGAEQGLRMPRLRELMGR